MGLHHPNARIGIPVCGITARHDEGEVTPVLVQRKLDRVKLLGLGWVARPIANGVTLGPKGRAQRLADIARANDGDVHGPASSRLSRIGSDGKSCPVAVYCCSEHGCSRIIIPIDDIDDQY